MPDREKCPACGRNAPTQEGDNNQLEFKNHAQGFKQGACPASGDPINTPPTEYHVPTSALENNNDPHVREGHGKPPEAHDD